MEIMKIHLGEEDISITTTYINLGMVYNELKQYTKAEKYLSLAMKVRKAHLPPQHPDIADCVWPVNGIAIEFNRFHIGSQCCC